MFDKLSKEKLNKIRVIASGALETCCQPDVVDALNEIMALTSNDVSRKQTQPYLKSVKEMLNGQR